MSKFTCSSQLPCVCSGLKEVRPRCLKEWRVLTYGKRTGSAASGMLCSPHAPHTAFGWLAGRKGGAAVAESYPGARYPALLVLAWVMSHCHTSLPGVPGTGCHLQASSCFSAGGKQWKHPPPNSPVSLSESWPWNASPGSSKAVSQLSPQG